MYRERWQFMRVPVIVDTYYHAKYNMLTTSHNTRGSSRFFPVRSIDESRSFARASEILLPETSRRCGVRDGSVAPVSFFYSPHRQSVKKEKEGDRKKARPTVFSNLAIHLSSFQ